MIHVSIGVRSGSEPWGGSATAAFEQATEITGATVEVVRLSQGVPAPVCFNRLAAESGANVVMLLDERVIPAHDALRRLVQALVASPGGGIAGPSTNLAWNEQCAFPAGLADDVETIAGRAARLFGNEVRTLDPLYSLSDFCYAVKHEVIEAIGGADERFGQGPCWEMEYNARAARAGFRGLWVCGAYVWRAPLSAARRAHEERLLEAGRRRYQDNLCGLRLRGFKTDYEPHCRGDACEYFAPRGLIQLRHPLPAASGLQPGEAGSAVIAPPRSGGAEIAPPQPLISCVMPTGNRAEFALQAARMFLAQDYPNRELIVVDDGADGLAELLPPEGITYVRCDAGLSVGEKRNLACTHARGEFIAEWDDDDWYGPGRLSAQLAPLLAARADITGIANVTILELEGWRFWQLTPALASRLFLEGIPSGTLVFRRSLWDAAGRQGSQFPAISVGEDAAFLRHALASGARLEPVDTGGVFIYVRHGRNTWQFICGRELDARGWRQVREPALPPQDRDFYAYMRDGERSLAPVRRPRPLVSCVMPTRDRRRPVGQAIVYFQRQDYPNRELVVLDDGQDPVEDLIPDDPRIRYVRLDHEQLVGAKRNQGCELASGEIIVNWDDDDWHSPTRISYQVDELERHGAEICGAGRILYFDPAAERAWLYEFPSSNRAWIAGGTLCYRKDLWRRNPYAPVGNGEDTRFVWSRAIGTPLVLTEHRFYAALLHHANTSRKDPRGPLWSARPIEDVKLLLGTDYRFYEQEAVGACRR
jgi:glycosyltransferase involved in cell wall biosynthesis